MISPSRPSSKRFWKVTTAPAIEPVTVEEVKDFARIDGNDSDSLIDGFIKAAREAGEAYLGRALIQQSITLYMDEWPVNPVLLPRPPLVSITAIRTRYEDGTADTYDSDNYYINANAVVGELIIKFGAVPPLNVDRYSAGYEVEFLAGYGAAASAIPQTILEGLKLWVTSMYENRVISQTPPPEARMMLDLYKVNRI